MKTSDSKLLSVPVGWKKGEPLVVSKIVIKGDMAWYIEQRPTFNFQESMPERGAIAAIWFYEREEFIRFIDWWY